MRERRVKVLVFKTTETKEKAKAIILAFKKSDNPLLGRKGGGREGDL